MPAGLACEISQWLRRWKYTLNKLRIQPYHNLPATLSQRTPVVLDADLVQTRLQD